MQMRRLPSLGPFDTGDGRGDWKKIPWEKQASDAVAPAESICLIVKYANM